MNRPNLRAKIALLAVLLMFAVSAQAQNASPAPGSVQDDDVVKITTKLVQVDAVVTDRDGKQVRDLSINDFELLQDGKRQTLSSVTYVNRDNADQADSATVSNSIRKDGQTQPPPAKIGPNNAGRLIAFLVDDGNCAVSALGMMASREGIEKFVRQQMLPNDRVAIFQTRNGSSMLQQYTNDRVKLLKVASKIKWYPPGGSCSSNDGSFTAAARANTFNKIGPNGSSSAVIETEDERRRRESIEDSNQNTQIVGTLGVMRYIVNGLSKVPGRKVMFLLSDGLPLLTRSGRTNDALSVLRGLTDLANRSSVVINTLDDRGVGYAGMIEARDEVTDTKTNFNSTEAISSSRLKAERNAQNGLAFIADETGGNFYRGQNFLDAPIKQALRLEGGYYLLAYEPEGESFKGKKFNRIEIKVGRPELKVAYRSGFLGISDDAIAKPARKTEYSELYEALVAPLPRAGMDLQLTAYFVNTENANLVRSLVHINGEDLQFEDAPNGIKRAVIDVVAVTMNEKNDVIDEFTRTHNLKVDKAAIPSIRKNGLIYTADVSVKNPGTYNLRLAVRDNLNKNIGSSSQIVQIPDLKKGGLYLSGLVITKADEKGAFVLPTAATAETAVALSDSISVPAIRRFNKGSVLVYAYTIYNARRDPANGQSKLTIQTNIYRNGVLISEGKPEPADIQKQNDLQRLQDYSYLRLDPLAESGEYSLQLIIRDTLAASKENAVTQWIDFEVVD